VINLGKVRQNWSYRKNLRVQLKKKIHQIPKVGEAILTSKNHIDLEMNVCTLTACFVINYYHLLSFSFSFIELN
jgi:hypothetical protein